MLSSVDSTEIGQKLPLVSVTKTSSDPKLTLFFSFCIPQTLKVGQKLPRQKGPQNATIDIQVIKLFNDYKWL